MKWRFFTLVSAGTFCLTGCNTEKPPSVNNQEDFLTNAEEQLIRQDAQQILSARAILNPTLGNKARGTITFTQVDNGIQIVADFENLTPGKHGLHVHEKPICSGDASGAGDHFNPTTQKHGGPDATVRHVGDFGNVEADRNGRAHYERIDTVIALSGPNSILNRSIILHEKADDFKTQPSGDSGKRIACGIIELVK